MPSAIAAPCGDAKPGEHENTNLDAIRIPVRGALAQLDREMESLLHTDTGLIGDVASYLISGQGKRLRPTLLLLAAGVFMADADETGEDAVALAAVVEFIHGATLLHDDVVDASVMRRGRLTANQRWDNETSVLVGDFLYSRAFQVLVRHASETAMAVLADTTNRIAEGEVQQLVNRNQRILDVQRYLGVIEAKTACLFAAAARLGAMVSGANEKECQKLADYGLAVGMAYQLVDDVLDYDAEFSETGKSPGNDLRDGKITLPLLYALQSEGHRQRELMERLDSPDAIEEIISMVKGGNAITRTMQLAKSYTSKALQALSGLPSGCCLTALQALAEFGMKRRF